jgi:hypothetical protein
MRRTTTLLNRSRALLVSVIALVAALAISGLLTGSASALKPSNRAVPAPPANPTRADQIQNIDQVKTAIKAYYGDTLSGKTNPDGTPEHLPSATGNYANEMGAVETEAQRFLDHWTATHPNAKGKKSILLDVDDTTLNTYNYEIASNFVYNPAINAEFVNAEVFPAVFHMTDLVNYATAHGYTIFYLTGRPEAQRAATEGNLTNVGYPVVDSQVYLKDLTKPIYSSCYNPPTATCTTTQYKSLTRAYIESQGYNIVANFGDQYSDLNGGYADKTFKLPNPMYYLP